jgi:transposase
MPQNFIGGDREQVLLMPPSLQEWLPQSHLAWFVLAAVEEMDLAAFYAAYRGDGVGRPAHDPAVMVALLLYAYSRGQRSSRRIEQACVEDIAHRVICVNEAPDHTTIARFRQRHQDAIAGLFSDVLRLCADAGLAGVGLVAVDGTKVHADASHHANRDYEQIAKEILAEADAIDAQEDDQFGDRRGDELPLELQTGRGRQEWLRAGRKRLEAERDADAKPIPASRPERLKESKRRLQEELWAEMRANEEYLAYRARGVMSNGRRLRPSTIREPWVAPEVPTGKINVTDPDSRNVKTPRGYLQGYNAQAICNEQQIVIAAEITRDPPDFGHLQPMITATERELHAAGIHGPA